MQRGGSKSFNGSAIKIVMNLKKAAIIIVYKKNCNKF